MREGGARPAGDPGGPCRFPQPDVADREGIRVAEGAHRNHLEGPGTDPRQGGQDGPRLGPVGPGAEVQRAGGEGGGERDQGGAAGGGHAQAGGIEPGDGGGRREQVTKAALWVLEGLTGEVDEASGERLGSAGAALLADHDPQGELGTVDGARHAPPRARDHEGTEGFVRAEGLVDGDRVGVEVEEPAAALDGGGQVTQIGQPERRGHVAVGGAQRRAPGSAGEPQRPPEGPVAPLLDARDGRGAEMAEETVRRHRQAERKPQRQPAGDPLDRPGPAGGGPGAQLPWRQGEDLPHRVVELPDAAEAGGEGDLGEGQVGRLGEDAGDLGTVRPGEGERPGAELGHERPLELAAAVAEPAGETTDAVAIDDDDSVGRIANECCNPLVVVVIRHRQGMSGARCRGRRAPSPSRRDRR